LPKEKIKENLEKMLEKISEIEEQNFTKENLEKLFHYYTRMIGESFFGH